MFEQLRNRLLGIEESEFEPTYYALLGLDPDQTVESDYLGLNHQGWFVRLRESGKDLLPALFEKVGDPEAARFFRVDPDVMKGMHALPLPYMRLFYHTEREVEKLRALARSRGEELSDLSQNLFDHYGNSNDPDLPDLIKGSEGGA